MNRLYAESHITPLARIYRKRVLPGLGLVQCRYGDQVTSDRIIAKADVPMGYHLLDLEDVLGTRIKDLDQVLVVKIGDLVGEGDLIARRRGIFKRECVSPVRGKVLDARRGKVLIEALPKHVELAAFYPGKIVNVVPERGAMIEVTGALVQGLWGTGEELRARLECVAPDGETLLTADMISAVHMGTILVGGRSLDSDAIAQAVENRVAAIVVGSVTSALVPAMEASDLSVIVTEGFGDFPMNPRTFALLRTYSGRETCFSPTMQARWQVRRPEIIIPMPVEGQVPEAVYGAKLEVGTNVRALRAPYENVVGKVVALPQYPQRVASGARTYGAEVELDGEGTVFIPLENIEIVR